MPHAGFKVKPGVDFNRTPALNEANLSYSNLVRFIYDEQGLGLVQKMGGWVKFFPNTIDSVVRSLHAWQTLNNIEFLAIGAESSLNVIYSGNLKTITPQELTVNPPVDVSTTSGSSVVTIKDVASAINSYDSVYIETQITVGGLRLQGLYPCIAVGSNTYQIVAMDVLGNPLAATSTVTDGGNIASFATTNGSYAITVTLIAHGYSIGDTVTFLVSTDVGGVTIYGNYIVNAVPSADTFQINANVTASYTDADVINNGLARYVYYHGIGPSAAGTGYGVGGYGSGGYGSGVTPITSRMLTTIGAKGTGTLATISHSTNTLVPVGSVVTVSGVTPSGYNGQNTVTASTSYNFDADTASGTGTTATLAGEDGAVIEVGTVITVANAVPSGYNGTFTVTASTANTVSYANTTTGSLTATARVNANTISYLSSTTGAQTVAGTIALISIPGISGNTDWSLGNWGEILIANPANGPIFQYQPASGTPVATILPYGPISSQGMFIAMPQRQIVAYGSTFNGVQDPLLIRWCDVEDFNVWIATTQNQAGSYRIPNGSRIVGCMQAPQQGLVWTDIGLWTMQYVGYPDVYSFNEVSSGCGMIARKACGSLNNVTYWMGPSQFYVLGASGPQPLPCPIWDVAFQDLDRTNLDKIRCGTNSVFGEVMWFYPTTSSGGEIGGYVKYNPALNAWDYGTGMNRTAWINQSVLGTPIGAGTDRYIYQHEIGNDADGQAMDSWFMTGFAQMSDGEWQWFVDQFWPDMKWGLYGAAQNATLQVTFYYCDYAGDTPTTDGPYSFNQATKFVTPRLRGRLFAIKLEGNDVGTFWRIGDCRFRYSAAGKY